MNVTPHNGILTAYPIPFKHHTHSNKQQLNNCFCKVVCKWLEESGVVINFSTLQQELLSHSACGTFEAMDEVLHKFGVTILASSIEFLPAAEDLLENFIAIIHKDDEAFYCLMYPCANGSVEIYTGEDDSPTIIEFDELKNWWTGSIVVLADRKA